MRNSAMGDMRPEPNALSDSEPELQVVEKKDKTKWLSILLSQCLVMLTPKSALVLGVMPTIASTPL